MSQARDSGHQPTLATFRRLPNGDSVISDGDILPTGPDSDPQGIPFRTRRSRLEAGYTNTMLDVVLLFIIAFIILFTATYINDTYYKNRPAYVLPAPEWTHYRRETFRTGLDLREFPSYDSRTILLIDEREQSVDHLFQSQYDRFGNIWYRVRYYRAGRFYEGWVHALYLH